MLATHPNDYDASTDAGLQLQNLISLADCLNDELLLIDVVNATVIASSAAFSQHYRDVIDGTELVTLEHELQGVSRMIEEFCASGERRQKAIIVNKESIPVAVELVMNGSRQVMVRCVSLESQQNEMQRYLHDREQLFLTSRTITVSEMATTLAHEINQPIGTIKNLLQGIKSRFNIVKENENMKQLDSCSVAVDRAIEQTEFAARIISRIRDYTQARTPDKQALDVHKLIRECLSLLDWEMDRQEIKCELLLSSHLLRVAGDELMLQQVIINLLRNAIDAMRDLDSTRRKLSVISTREAGQVIIQIKDVGCGLDEKAERQLFQPFVSNKPGGMGVGLNICRSFIELHQGRLWLTNNQLSGCTSHVSLPEINDMSLAKEAKTDDR